MVAAGDQQEETIPRRAPADLKLSCLPFWTFVYQEAAGTHWALAQLYELCHQWLRPEVHSQEQMLELLVLEQFLSILAYKVLLSVEVQHHESCKKAVSLVEDLTKALEEPGPSGGGWMSSAISSLPSWPVVHSPPCAGVGIYGRCGFCLFP
ncbi:zinc finger and SCAN domain-containing protein 18-like [Equus przewalskii]|uniref:SCAN box domain-containing protein n=2 Tax=Equus TaxID=9789 RepID=A0A9L0SN20_HORSE